MTKLNVIDENTGKFVEVDIDTPSGNLYVRDADTGEFTLLDLSAPVGIVKAIDAKTGEFFSIDYSSPTGVINVIDQNTGEFMQIDLSTPVGILYVRDENTGNLLAVDIASAKFFKSGNTILGGTAATYHLNFDGIDDVLTIPASASLNNLPLGDFTVEFVAKILPNGNETTTGVMVSKYGSAPNFPGWDFFLVNSGVGWRFLVVDIVVSDATDYLYLDSPASLELPEVNDGEFHHFELNYFSVTRTVKVFIDGVIQEEGTFFTSPGFVTNGYIGNDTPGDLIIGGFEYGFPAYHKGSDRWFRISNVARHSSSFTPPSLTACPATDANTVLLLALDEGTGTTVADTSGNNNNGTITGATWEAD